MLRDFAVEAGFAGKGGGLYAVHTVGGGSSEDYWGQPVVERGHGLRDRGSGEARRTRRVAGDSGDGTSCGVRWSEGQVGRGDGRWEQTGQDGEGGTAQAAAGEPVEAAGPGRRASRFGLDRASSQRNSRDQSDAQAGVGTASRIPDLTCRDVGQGLMVLVDVSIADPQREGNVQLRRATPTQIGVGSS
ncbi:unnamed protein product [Closterium sp. NIES-64]|nr:unnamed protein product [Closterium sp. NIES-64]